MLYLKSKYFVFFLLSLLYISNIESSLQGTNNKTTFIHDIIGKNAPNCVYLGMWTYHFDPRWRGRNDNWLNNAFGIQYDGVFLTTLVNSHYNRCITFGVTKDWIGYHPFDDTRISFGYRLGGIYGYGKELNKYAEMCPIMPIYQLCAQLQYKRARLEFSYFRSLLSLYFTIVYGDY